MEINAFVDISRFCQIPPPMSKWPSVNINAFIHKADNQLALYIVLAILATITVLIWNVAIANVLSLAATIMFWIWLGNFRSRGGPNSIVRSPYRRRFLRGSGALATARGLDRSYSPGMWGTASGPFPMSSKKKKRRNTFRR